MSLLTGRKAYLPLEHNVKYNAILRGYTDYEPTEEQKKTRPDSQGFIAFKFELEDGRTITDSRSFPVGSDLLAKQLLVQLGKENAIDQVQLFRECIEGQIPLGMWVVQNDTYTNYTFTEPVATAPAIANTAPVDTAGTFK